MTIIVFYYTKIVQQPTYIPLHEWWPGVAHIACIIASMVVHYIARIIFCVMDSIIAHYIGFIMTYSRNMIAV